MEKLDEFRVEDAQTAFGNFHEGLRRALKLSKEELDQRVAKANAARTAERIENGHGKPGPKSAHPTAS